MHEPMSPEPADRRAFVKVCALAIGGGISTLPFAAGVIAFLDPLRRQAEAGGFLRVASLAALPADGLPRKFSVIATRTDAWNKFPNVPIGAVYLRRTGEQTVEAFNVVCPHAGCFVDFKEAERFYLCPCHNSTFNLDGSIRDKKSPSPRGLDPLEVEIRNGTEVWVQFRNFRAGTRDRQPLA